MSIFSDRTDFLINKEDNTRAKLFQGSFTADSCVYFLESTVAVSTIKSNASCIYLEVGLGNDEYISLCVYFKNTKLLK